MSETEEFYVRESYNFIKYGRFKETFLSSIDNTEAISELLERMRTDMCSEEVVEFFENYKMHFDRLLDPYYIKEYIERGKTDLLYKLADQADHFRNLYNEWVRAKKDPRNQKVMKAIM